MPGLRRAVLRTLHFETLFFQDGKVSGGYFLSSAAALAMRVSMGTGRGSGRRERTACRMSRSGSTDSSSSRRARIKEAKRYAVKHGSRANSTSKRRVISEKVGTSCAYIVNVPARAKKGSVRERRR